MTGPQSVNGIEGRLRNFENLLQQINSAVDADTQAKVSELIRLLMEYHAAGLERLMELVWDSGPSGQELIDGPMVKDDLVSSLLLLHGLHPLDLSTRVIQALEQVRPYMHSHGGDVELLEVTGMGVIRLRLEGTCNGCPSSRVTLKYAVEKAIFTAAPDAAGLEVEGTSDPHSGPAPESSGTMLPADGGDSWGEVIGLASLKSGTVRTLDVNGQAVLFCRVGESLLAYGNICPSCGELLGRAKLEGIDLVCPACGERYDVLRAGRNLDQPHLHLEPIPLLEEGSHTRVAILAKSSTQSIISE